MPKMKTRRAATKQFKVNRNGKVKFKRAYLRHCLEQQPKEREKRKLRRGGTLFEGDAEHMSDGCCLTAEHCLCEDHPVFT